MRSFQEIFDQAAAFRGGSGELEAVLAQSVPRSSAELAAIADDRWLAQMSKCVFQAGFSWKVIESKWPEFEVAFEGFGVPRWAMAADEDIDRLLSDRRIVRYGRKIKSVRDNAIFLSGLARQHGTAARVFADWPSEDFTGLLEFLKKNGSRLGGATAQYFLRFIGKDSFILSRDVTAALIRDGVIDKQPTSKSAQKTVQQAFNHWMAESGRSMTHVSRVLAISMGPPAQPAPH